LIHLFDELFFQNKYEKGDRVTCDANQYNTQDVIWFNKVKNFVKVVFELKIFFFHFYSD